MIESINVFPLFFLDNYTLRKYYSLLYSISFCNISFSNDTLYVSYIIKFKQEKFIVFLLLFLNVFQSPVLFSLKKLPVLLSASLYFTFFRFMSLTCSLFSFMVKSMSLTSFTCSTRLFFKWYFFSYFYLENALKAGRVEFVKVMKTNRLFYTQKHIHTHHIPLMYAFLCVLHYTPVPPFTSSYINRIF